MTSETYQEILKIWNQELPDDFEICTQLYYENHDCICHTKVQESKESVCQFNEQ